MPVGAMLRSARRRAGLTQAEVAARVGTSQPVISAYEHDRRDPTLATFTRLVEATGARLDLRLTPIAAPEPVELGRMRDEPVGTPADATTRGRVLVDLLLLADALPPRPRGALTFPRLSSVSGRSR